MRRSADLAIAVAALGLLLLVSYVSHAQRSAVAASTYSSFDYGPNGYAALYELLRREGVRVSRLEVPLHLARAHVRTIVVAQSPYPAQPRDLLALYRWVKAGGHLVLLGKTALRNDRRFDQRHLRIKRIADPGVFSNAQLARDDRARRAYALLAGGPVAFDERVQGYALDRGFWPALPWPLRAAIVLAVAAVVLAAIGAAVPHAPPLASPQTDDGANGDYIESMARLLQRAHARRDAIARLMPEGPARGRAWAARRSLLDELSALHAQRRPNEAHVLRAGVLAARLRKESNIT